MHRRDFIRAIAAVGGSAALPAPAFSQTYPTGPVTVVLPLQVGSASDAAVRAATAALSTRMHASFVVENMAAAAGLVGLDRVARAAPDGLTLGGFNNSIVTILPHLQPDHMKFDTRVEFVPIAGFANIPTFFAVSSKSTIRNIQDLIAQARQRPDKIVYSSGGVGSPQHMATEMFKAYTGTKLFHVPYRGATQAALALATGEVEVMSMALSLAQPFLPDGKVRLIGYCGRERLPEFADIPTLIEQGVPDYEYSSWVGLFAQKNVPADVVSKLRPQLDAVANDPQVQAQLVKSGLIAWPRTAAQLSKIVQDDYERWGKIVKEAHIEQT
jgi:tripartite-type tricarboxylate transporter receptor subunit TctC